MEHKEPGIICCGKGLLNGLLFRFVVRSFLFAVPLLAVSPPLYSQSATELGSEGDLVVLGTGGTALDPNVKIKGFTVFGSTQAVYTGAVTGNGNVVVNGVLAVSSGAYFVGNSTFTGANKIFVNDGSPGQILGKNTGGWLEWFDAGSIGDNLGNHVATTTLQMGAYGVNTSSAVTAARYQINGSTVLALTGVGSLAVGPNAGTANTGSYSVFVGSSAGLSNTTGESNSFLGAFAGRNNTTGTENTFVGAAAGRNNATGNFNSILGVYAGFNGATGGNNTFVGYSAGYYNQGGSANSVLGNFAGGSGAGGINSFSSSTIIGSEAGYSLQTGGDNIFLGWKAGYAVTTGTGNIVIGYNKDTSAPAASSQLNIGGVLYGDLSAKTVGINRVIPQAALDIVSTGTAANIYAQIWRNGSGVVVASMTSQGALYATLPPGAGDNLGNHTATQDLLMSQKSILSVASITVVGKGLQIGTDLTSSASGVFISTSGQVLTLGLGNGSAAPDVRGQGAVDLQTRRTAGTQVASGRYSVIGGGDENWATALSATVSGGSSNRAIGDKSTVGGGSGNLASGTYFATVAGGGQNTASGDYSVVGGGYYNTASGINSVIGGGWFNRTNTSQYTTVGGGEYNTATGLNATVPGGSYNTAKGDYSFAAGRKSSATAQGSFAISDSQNAVFEVGTADQFGARFQGGYLFSGGNVGIGTVSSGAKLEVAGQVKITGGSPGAGKVLTSDAAGLATWGTASGDNLGNHVATTTLQMGAYGVNTTSAITAGYYQVNGSTVLAILPSGSLGLGPAAGRLTTGSNNHFLGGYTGYNNTSGVENTAIGNRAGYNNTTASYNSFAGSYAGYSNSVGANNSFIGYASAYSNTTGADNSVIGVNAARNNQTGSANAILGNQAGYGSSGSFSSSTLVGYKAGFALTTGSDNILLGWQAGDALTTGGRNIIIGYDIDAPAAAGSNQLSIGNLIFATGVDGTGTAISNGSVGIGVVNPGAKLEVAGQVKITGGSPGAGKVLTSDAAGLATWGTAAGDNLGNHVATTTLNLNGQSIVSAASGTFTQGITASSVTLLNVAGAGLSVSSSAYLAVSGGFVGIGTTAPGYPLVVQTNGTGTTHVSNIVSRLQANAAGRDVTLQFSDNATYSNFISMMNGNFLFTTSNPGAVDAMYIKSDGNVGIGTTAPGAKLEVKQSALDSYAVKVSSNDGTGMAVVNNQGNVGIGTTGPNQKLDVFGAISSGVNDYTYNAAVYQLTNQSRVDGISGTSPTGAFRWYTNPNNSDRSGFLYQLRSYDTTNGESAGLVTFKGDGNVGIGTTNPLTILNVKQTSANVPGIRISRTQADGNPQLQFSDDVTYANTIEMRAGTGDILIAKAAGNVGIGTASPSERLHVAGNILVSTAPESPILFASTTTGNVGIGTTNPAVRLHIHEPAGTAYQKITSGGGNGSAIHMGANIGGAEKWGTIYLDTAGNLKLLGGSSLSSPGITVNQSGNVGIGTTGPSERLHVAGNVLVSTAATSPVLYVSTTTGNVGIGTTVPASKLVVDAQGGNTGWTDTALAVIGADTSSTKYILKAVNPNGGGNGLIVRNDGNVGIGTTGPGVNLHVLGDTGAKIERTGHSGKLSFYIQGAASRITTPDSTTLTLGHDSNVGRLVIDTAGNVGIGTTSPAYKLDVNGDVQATNFRGNGSLLAGITGATGGVSNTVNTNIVADNDSNGSGQITFTTGVTDRMVMLNGGNVGIGTTSPAYRLDVQSGENNATPILRLNTSDGFGYTFTRNLSGFLEFDGNQGASVEGYIFKEGNVGIGTTSPQASLHISSTSATNLLIVSSGTQTGQEIMTVTKTGNVGIGTTGPNQKFTVVSGAANYPAAYIGNTAAAGSSRGLTIDAGSNSSDFALNLRDRLGTAGLFYVGGDGRAGVGTAAPSYRLEVSSGAGEAGTILAVSTGASAMIELQGDGDVIAKRFLGDGSQLTGIAGAADNLGNHVATATLNMANFGVVNIASITVTNFIRTSTLTVIAPDTVASSLWVSTSATMPHLYVSTGGNVGIGTTSPSEKLSVNGAARLDGLLKFYNESGGAGAGVVGNLGVYGGDSATLSVNRGLSATRNFRIHDGSAASADGSSGLLLSAEGSSGRVGIGTISPTAKLHIGGTPGVDGIRFPDGTLMTSAGVGSASNLANAADAVVNGDSDANGSGAVRLQTGAADRLYIANGGNVGIGTTSPGTLVHVEKSQDSYLPLLLLRNPSTTGSSGVSRLAIAADDYGQISFFDDLATDFTAGPPASISYDVVSDDLILNNNGTLVLDTTGNVGIGTAMPVNKFEIRGTAATPATSGSAANGVIRAAASGFGRVLDIGVSNGASLYSWIQSRDDASYASNYDLALQPNGGNVGIGTPGPTHKLRVEGGILATSSITAQGGFYGDGTTLTGVVTNPMTSKLNINASPSLGTQNQAGIAIDTHVFVTAGNVGIGTTTPQGLLHVGAGATPGLLVNSSGNVGIGTAGPGTILDVRGANKTNANEHGTISLYSTDSFAIDKGGSIGFFGKYNTAGGYANFARIYGAKENSTDGLFQGYIAFALSPNGTPLERMRITSTGNVGISTGAPQARLDVLAAGSAPTDMVQIWRRVDGVVVGSMSATGYLQAVKFIGDGSGLTGMAGDNLGSHIATTDLNMSGQAVFNASSMTITGAGVSGAGPVFTVAGSTLNVLANGNVGIGTTGPSAKLEVTDGDIRSGIEITAGYPFLKLMNINANANARNWALSHSIIEQGDFAILQSAAKDGDPVTAATSRLYFGGSGNVGIGTTGPDAPLAFGNGFTTKIKFYDSGSDEYGIGLDGSGHLNLFGGNSADTNIRTGGESGTALMTLKASGNVGIGTTAPGQKLVVAESGAGSVFTSWQNSDTGYANTDGFSIGLDSSEDANVWNRENTNMVFATNNAERMRLTSAGNVGVGTTGPGAKLEVKQSASDSYAVKVSSNDGTGMVVVNNQGNVGIGTTSPGYGLEVVNSAGVHLSTTATAGYGLYLNSAGNVTIARYTVLAADTGITLTSADFGKTITVNSASAQTVSLPSVTGADIGATVTVVKLGAGTVTIQAAASTFIADSGSGQTIYNNSPAETYSTITLRLTTSTMWSILGGNGSWTTTN